MLASEDRREVAGYAAEIETNGRMQVSLLRELPSDEEFREQWNSLAESMERPQVFYTWEWAQAVCLAYGTQDLFLVVAYRGGRLTGVAAFSATEDGEISFLTATTADYCEFVSAAEDRAEFVRLTVDLLRAKGIQEFRLTNLPALSVTVAALRSAVRNAGYFLYARPAYRCAQIRLDLQNERLRAEKSARSRQRKSKFQREAGRTEVAHLKSWDAAGASLVEFEIAHVGRFLARGMVSNLAKPERRCFLEELGRLLSRKGWLKISTVNLNGKAIAWNYGMSFGGTWFWYQPAFDNDYQHNAPGNYLLCEIILAAVRDTACHTIDLGLGAEDYKARHANSDTETLYVTASHSLYRISREICRYRMASLVRRSQRAENLARKCRELFARLRHFPSATLASRVSSRFRSALLGRSEVHFFEWPAGHAGFTDADDVTLQPLTLRSLALAVMEHEQDHATLQYLLRSAARLHSSASQGFVLTNGAGIPLHFCWVVPFANVWIAEIGRKLDEPAPGSVLILDCWTPSAKRGNGYYAQCLQLVAQKMLAQNLHPWIFSAAENLPSLHGIARAGFVSRFTVARKTRLGFMHNWEQTATEPGGKLIGLDPAA